MQATTQRRAVLSAASFSSFSKSLPAPSPSFVDNLARTSANHAPLSPIQWIERAAIAFPNTEALRYRYSKNQSSSSAQQQQQPQSMISRTWSETRNRAVSLASSLSELGCERGEVVQVMLSNRPEMAEAHFAVPMTGAVLGCINTRLDASVVSYILDHSEAKVLIFEEESFGSVVRQAVEMLPLSARPILVRVVNDADHDHHHQAEKNDSDYLTYESLVQAGNPNFLWSFPADEFDALSLNYTSGTTGRPKGCVMHHRGAYLAALGNILAFDGMGGQKVTRYLWTLPMFHANGWNFPYSMAALGGTNICLDTVSENTIAEAVEKDGVTHCCGAPIVLQMLIDACRRTNADDDDGNDNHNETNTSRIQMMVAAAPPPAKLLSDAAAAGIHVTHTYGLTESYGPATVCQWQGEGWDVLPPEERAQLKSRQGVRYVTNEELTVLHPDTDQIVPNDGVTMGEVAMRGNMVFKGYHKNEEETAKALKNGYFRTGDLGVIDPDGYVALKDRKKDIIISGGENISSIEVENCLYGHSKVLAVAVVAMPHAKWQEVGCAFVETTTTIEKDGDNREMFEKELIQFCKDRIPRFSAPHKVVVGPLPKTSTGKIQKFILRNTAKNFSDFV